MNLYKQRQQNSDCYKSFYHDIIPCTLHCLGCWQWHFKKSFHFFQSDFIWFPVIMTMYSQKWFNCSLQCLHSRCGLNSFQGIKDLQNTEYTTSIVVTNSSFAFLRIFLQCTSLFSAIWWWILHVSFLWSLQNVFARHYMHAADNMYYFCIFFCKNTSCTPVGSV